MTDIDALRLNVRKFCWSVLPETRHHFEFLGLPGMNLTKHNDEYKFQVSCQAPLKNVVVPKGVPEFDINVKLNTFFMDGQLSKLRIHEGESVKEVHMESFYQSKGAWKISDPFSLSLGRDQSVSFQFDAHGRWPMFRVAFVGHSPSSPNPSAWSVLPSIDPQYECQNLQSMFSNGLQDWSPCLDQFRLNWTSTDGPKRALLPINHFKTLDLTSLPQLASDAECTVYSIGTSNNFDFDLLMAALGCTVHSFDCTVLRQDVQDELADRIHFHRWCLVSENELQKNDRESTRTSLKAELKQDWTIASESAEWNVFSIIEILEKLKHSEKTLSILKIDCEGCEFDVLSDLVAFENGKYLTQINDLFLELHSFPKMRPFHRESNPINSLVDLFICLYVLLACGFVMATDALVSALRAYYP